ncbi:uncharacterized protein LOC113790622 [Dermatophagoides pteronyssinus]|uniref:uncharacterized protein LOC113790622 n=1 Tax=Dermatophagoides pteronyssinus TaxID=6956 RepID=UPI003F671E1E
MFFHFEIFVPIACCLLISGVHNERLKQNHSTTLSSPILWHPSSHAVAQQIVFHTINFTIQSPCSEFIRILSFNVGNDSISSLSDDFLNFDYHFNQTIKRFHLLCQNLYNQLVVSQIRSNCREVDEIRIQMPDMKGHTISKRSLAPKDIASISWMSVVTSLGYFTQELLSKFDVGARLNELELNYATRMQQLDWYQKLSTKIHDELSQQMVRLHNNVDKTLYRVSQQNIFYAALSTLYMSINSKLYQVDSDLKNFFESLKKKKISKDFQYLFPNLTLCNSSQKCPREYWNGHGCETLVSDETNGGNFVNMILKLSTVIVHPINQILEVDPFVIKKSPNETSTCFYEYNGRQLFLYDSNTNCIRNVNIPKPKNPSAIILANEIEDPNVKKTRCSNWSDFLDEFWRKSYCKNTKDLSAEETVQIKTDDYYNYIYCSGFNLTILDDEYGHRSFQCNNNIHRLNLNTSFMIGNISFLLGHEHHNVQSYLVPINEENVDSANETISEQYLREQRHYLMQKHNSSLVSQDQGLKKLKMLLEHENNLILEIEDERNKLLSFFHARFMPWFMLFIFLIVWPLSLIICFYCSCCCSSCFECLCCCRSCRSKPNRR